MTDLGVEVAALLEKTEQTRNDFLRVEIEACAIALDMARFEYDRRNTPFAAREVESAKKGIAVIERFLPRVREPQKAAIRIKLVRLQAVLESVRRDFQGKAA